jgi:hypothetical protein
MHGRARDIFALDATAVDERDVDGGGRSARRMWWRPELIHDQLAEEQLPAAQLAAEKATLQRNGFREAAREDLTNGGNTAAFSLVEQFRSPQAARAALTAEVASIKAGAAGTLKAFPVHGIPGAEGFGDTQNSGINIASATGLTTTWSAR